MKRGRKSVDDLAMTTVVDATFGKRVPPPQELSPRQKQIWIATARGEPAEFFGTQALQTLLKTYCVLVENIERISAGIDKIGDKWQTDKEALRQWTALTKLRQRESSAMALMATKLRITNQSRYNRTAAATQAKASSGPTPWERKGAA